MTHERAHERRDDSKLRGGPGDGVRSMRWIKAMGDEHPSATGPRSGSGYWPGAAGPIEAPARSVDTRATKPSGDGMNRQGTAAGGRASIVAVQRRTCCRPGHKSWRNHGIPWGGRSTGIQHGAGRVGGVRSPIPVVDENQPRQPREYGMTGAEISAVMARIERVELQLDDMRNTAKPREGSVYEGAANRRWAGRNARKYFPCPSCEAVAGDPCTSKKGKNIGAHATRHRLARQHADEQNPSGKRDEITPPKRRPVPMMCDNPKCSASGSDDHYLLWGANIGSGAFCGHCWRVRAELAEAALLEISNCDDSTDRVQYLASRGK